MLKITKVMETATRIRMKLYGRFTNEYVSEIEKALSDDGSETSKVTLDLSNVSFVDRQAMEFLSGAILRNVTIENTPPYVTRWIEQETQNSCFEFE